MESMNSNTVATSFNVLEPKVAIDSMRSNGYLTTDTAIAELIDNAIDANATAVEVYLHEKYRDGKRSVARITSIDVLDNGDGMSPDELRNSLRFGAGTRIDRKRYGRFGFGLPNSSISQANRVEVWSWQNGIGNALYTYLDINEIREGKYVDVPVPKPRPVNTTTTTHSVEIKQTGTLVSWSDLDQHITWKKGSTVLSHTTFLVGRIYRHRLSDKSLSIRFVVIDPEGEVSQEEFVEPNDPLYITPVSSLQLPDGTEHNTMFQEYGSPTPFTLPGRDGKPHTAYARFSWARPEFRKKNGMKQAGDQPHGKHALRNQGVSIVRHGREIRLSDAISIDKYRDRWWGIEIDFPPDLDELFGVTNSKQDAVYLVDALKRMSTGGSKKGPSIQALIDAGEISDDEPTAELFRMAQKIYSKAYDLANKVAAQNENSLSDENGSTPSRHIGRMVPLQVNNHWERRQSFRPTLPEQQETHQPTPGQQTREALLERFEEIGLPPADAEAIIDYAFDQDRRVVFVDAPPTDDAMDAFFFPQDIPGARVLINFNTEHPVYSRLVSMLNIDLETMSQSDLIEQLQITSNSLRLLFASWARMEFEAAPGKERKAIQRVRNDWGRIATDFFDDEPDDE